MYLKSCRDCVGRDVVLSQAKPAQKNDDDGVGDDDNSDGDDDSYGD